MRQQAARAARSASASRRGVILLVSLALLTLFLLISLTFVLIASQARRTARVAAKREQRGNPPEVLLDLAFQQVVSGTKSLNSPLRPHSLLEDLYGNDGFEMVVSLVTPVGANSGIVSLVLELHGPDDVSGALGAGTTNEDDLVGFDQQPGIAGVDDDRNGTIDDVGELPQLNSTNAFYYPAPGSDDVVLSQVDGAYNGRLLTPLSGAAQGQSTRILHYQYGGAALGTAGPHAIGTATFYVVGLSPGATPAAGDRVLINGRPFNGTGFGLSFQQLYHFDPTSSGAAPGPTAPLVLGAYDPTPQILGLSPVPDPMADVMMVGTWPYALLPNAAHFTPTLPPIPGPAVPPGNYDVYADPAGPGGADEDYDAVDYQNMLLALKYWSSSPGDPLRATVSVPSPSLHRPELINFWRQSLGSATFDASSQEMRALRRKVMLRPWGQNSFAVVPEHPNFPSGGAGAPFNPITGPWDVDNDSDSVADSVWVDLGMPVETAPDGRLYKPLFAILCVDMDGKLNLNAHGNPNQLAANQTINIPLATAEPATYGRVFSVGTSALGYGPAEVNLGGVLGLYGYDGYPGGSGDDGGIMPAQNDPTEFLTSMTDDLVSVGFDGRPGVAFVDDDGGPGVIGVDDDGINGVDDPGEVKTDDVVELLAAGSDDLPVLGGDGGSGQNSTDDDGFTGADDLYEFGWPGTDDFSEYARLLRGAINPADPAQRIDGRYGEIARTPGFGPTPPLGPVNTILSPGPGLTSRVDLLDRPNGTNRASWIGVQDLMDGMNVLRQMDVPPVAFGSSPASAFQPYANVGFDGAQGILGYDDENDGTADNDAEWGWARSDDVMNPSGWMSPFDLDGDGLLVLDWRGQPIWAGAAGSSTNYQSRHGFNEPNERWDSPYDVDLSQATRQDANMLEIDGGYQRSVFRKDALFAPGELETLLRSNDRDVSALSNRLRVLSPTLAMTPKFRSLVTTESWDLPVPNIVVPVSLMYQMGSIDPGGPYNVTDNPYPTRPGAVEFESLVAMAIQRASGTAPTVAQLSQALSGDFSLPAPSFPILPLFAPELIAGQRMDLNRPFGDGVDNNFNGVVDEPSEVLPDSVDNDVDGTTDEPKEQDAVGLSNVALVGITDGAGTPATFDHSRDGARDALDERARYEYARQLYCLVMLLMDTNSQINLGSTVAPSAATTARYVAQWAINVADFRDPDSIMTAFEYDREPFENNDGSPDGSTWDVDGWLGPTPGPDGDWGTSDTGEGPSADDTSMAAYRDVVWGCERPELLINETLAFHDHRTDDLAVDGMVGPMGDIDLDQPANVVPEGSLFVELFNPWSSPDTVPDYGVRETPPGELYDTDRRGVWLNAKANRNIGNSPIWRLVVKDPSETTDPAEPVLPDTAIERTVYFTDPTAAKGGVVSLDEGRIQHYSTFGDYIVEPRRYAVVGPAADPAAMYPDRFRADQYDTPVGQADKTTMPTYTYPRVLRLDPTAAPGQQVVIRDGTPTVQFPYQYAAPPSPWYDLDTATDQRIQPPVAIPMDSAFRQTSTTTVVRRLSVSEPFDGYTAPVADNDVPLDNTANNIEAFPTADDGTVAEFRTIYLQRLANPLLEWNPIPGHPSHDNDRPVNPYVTIDELFVDLTVYTGSVEYPTGVTDPNPPAPVGTNPLFVDSLERGGHNLTPPPRIWNNLLYVTAASGHNTPMASGLGRGLLFPNPPIALSSLGYVNAYALNLLPFDANVYHCDETGMATRLPGTDVGTASTNHMDVLPGNVPARRYVGEPELYAAREPWLVWNNRPFVSAGELMQVPALSPSSFLRKFDLSSEAARDTYQRDATNNPLPFPHLANFFLRDATSGNNLQEMPVANVSPQLHRLFEFVHVPSRYAGTESYLPLWQAGAASVYQAPAGTSNTLFGSANAFPFCAPFNKVSSYREPGKINLNTVFDQEVWQGLVSDLAKQGWGQDTVWDEIVQSRQAYGGTAYARSDSYPTLFPNPFRSFGGTHLVPLNSLRTVMGVAGTGESVDILSTWLRPGVTGTVPPEEGLPGPLFGLAGTVSPTFSTGPWPPVPAGYTNNPSVGQYNDPNRNAYFRYLMYQRLSNLVTTRSNVYAVWITVGYFEVEPAPPAEYAALGYTPQEFREAFPDGYRPGKELGLDDGSVQRHRSFYLFDRSIPMAFERGERHNTDQGVLVKRYIE